MDERTNDGGTNNDPQRALSGFLSESTRRARRTLLAVSAGAIALRVLDVKLGTFVVFGTPVTIPPERVQQGLGLALLYFIVLFVVYMGGDLIRQRGAMNGVMDGLSVVKPKVGFSMATLAGCTLALRLMLDVGLPIVLGAVALVVTG